MIRLVMLCIWVFYTRGWANTYYVDKGSAQAGDPNPGTAALPWLTIQHAIDLVQPGDTIYVKTGTYNETLLMKTDGQAGAPIVIKSLPRRTARVDRIMLTRAYTRVEGFEITFSTSGTATGVNITGDHTEVVDNYIYNMGTGVNINKRSRVYVGGNRIYHCQYGIMVTGTNVLFENNEVERLYQYNTSGDCDYCRFFGDTLTFKGNYFHGTIPAEIGNAHLDCWQTWDDNGEHATQVVWDGNWCSECAEGVMAGCTLGSATHDFTFVNNVFAHSWSWGLCMGIISNTSVYNNVFYDIYNHAIGGFGGATNIVVKNNIFLDAGSGYWTEQGAPMVADYNLVYRTSTPGISGAHNLIGVDPQFVNAAAGDFSLKPTSPAINAGTTVPVTTDRDGNVRPYNGAYDIGAYEYGAPPAIGIMYTQDPEHSAAGPGTIPNPLTAEGLRQLTGQSNRYTVFDMNGRTLLVQTIRKNGVYLLQNMQTGATQRIMVLR